MPADAVMPVSVVIERRRIDHPWQDHSWRPVGVLPHVAGEPWKPMVEGDGWAQFQAGSLQLALYRGETEGYLANLSQELPVVYVVLRRADETTEAEAEVEPFLVTVCPARGDGLSRRRRGHRRRRTDAAGSTDLVDGVRRRLSRRDSVRETQESAAAGADGRRGQSFRTGFAAREAVVSGGALSRWSQRKHAARRAKHGGAAPDPVVEPVAEAEQPAAAPNPPPAADGAPVAAEPAAAERQHEGPQHSSVLRAAARTPAVDADRGTRRPFRLHPVPGERRAGIDPARCAAQAVAQRSGVRQSRRPRRLQ